MIDAAVAGSDPPGHPYAATASAATQPATRTGLGTWRVQLVKPNAQIVQAATAAAATLYPQGTNLRLLMLTGIVTAIALLALVFLSQRSGNDVKSKQTHGQGKMQ